MQLDERPRQRPRIVTRQVRGETLLVPLRSSPQDAPFLYTLNAVGAWVWERADGSRTVAELIQGVADAFETTAAEAERDVREFVDALEEEKLLEAAAIP